MHWPSNLDYRKAVLNPPLRFKDDELKEGKTVKDQSGRPIASQGSYACVFQIIASHKWAIRCFLRHFDDTQERYDVISTTLKNKKLSCIVDFTYVPEGICVNGIWYPILKMEWVDGQCLDEYIQEKLDKSPSAIQNIAETWALTAKMLREAGISHGDLHCKNIMVTPDNQIKLVDYDDIFVPALKGRKSHGIGYPGYQHPYRTEDDYNENVDSFPSLVIYLSILALADDPSRAARYKVFMDDNILFRKEDFLAPDKSRLFQELLSSENTQIKLMAEALKASCLDKTTRIPYFDEVKKPESKTEDTPQSVVKEETKFEEPIKLRPKTLLVNKNANNAFKTITKALESANPGDTIQIYPGIYKEALVIDKSVVIQGKGNPKDIIIESTGQETVSFRADEGEISSLTLRQSGTGDYPCVDIKQGILTLEECNINSLSDKCIMIQSNAISNIQNCQIYLCSGSGVYIQNGGFGDILNNVIYDIMKVGIVIKRNSSAVIKNNQIYNCGRSGIYIYDRSQGTILSNKIFQNEKSGVVISKASKSTIENNIIYSCARAAVLFIEKSDGLLQNNDIKDNLLAGVEITSNSTPILVDNHIRGNGNAGIFIHGGGSGSVTHNTIAHNLYAGIEIDGGTQPSIKRNYIMSNHGAGIYIYNNGSAIIEDNNIKDNSEGAFNISRDSQARTRSFNNETS